MLLPRRQTAEKESIVSSFPGVDYMEIDSLFTEEELMVRQTVRDFVDEEVLPIIEEANRHEKFPADLIPKMGEMGLFGATINEYGPSETLLDLSARLVAERLAEGEAEEAVRDPLLSAVPGELQPILRIELLDQENAVLREEGVRAREERIPLGSRNAVEHVEHRHEVELATHGIVERGDEPDARAEIA